MDIGVLVKQVPDTESIVQIAGDGVAIKKDDIKWVMNPYDELAVEEARADELFSQTDWPNQTRKMLLTIMMVVDNLRDAAHMKKMLHEANLVHQKFSLQSHDFDALTDAIISTMAEFSGDTWSTELESAWRAAFSRNHGADA